MTCKQKGAVDQNANIRNWPLLELISPFVYVLSVLVILLAGCRRGASNATAPPLLFYVVSEGKIEGGRFIDTPDFPKLGYIAPAPELVIRRLQAATMDTSVPYPAIRIDLRSEDAQQFSALTERAAGKKLLLMLGDMPLAAPRVMERIPTASVMLGFGEGTDSKKAMDGLKMLVR
jgi:hypothetical protein